MQETAADYSVRRGEEYYEDLPIRPLIWLDVRIGLQRKLFFVPFAFTGRTRLVGSALGIVGEFVEFGVMVGIELVPFGDSGPIEIGVVASSV